MTILALDLGRNLGFACGDPPCAPTFGTYEIPGRTDGARYAWFWQWLGLRGLGPNDVLAIERPFIGNPSSVAWLHGLWAIGQLFGQISDIRVETLQSIHAAAHLCGPVPRGRKRKKQATVDACHARGWMVRNDNEADACALLAYCAAKILPQEQHYPPPLFAGAA